MTEVSVPHEKNKTVSDIISEYGQAVRGDWGSIDGRSVRDDMDTMSLIVRKYGDMELPPKAYAYLAYQFGLCVNGGGHWLSFCENYGEEDVRESDDFWDHVYRQGKGWLADKGIDA